MCDNERCYLSDDECTCFCECGMPRSQCVCNMTDEATDLIRKGDLIKRKLVNGKFSIDEVLAINVGKYSLIGIRNYLLSKEDVLAIWKPIGKDYICVWEKE